MADEELRYPLATRPDSGEEYRPRKEATPPAPPAPVGDGEPPSVSMETLTAVTVAGARVYWELKDLQRKHEEAMAIVRALADSPDIASGAADKLVDRAASLIGEAMPPAPPAPVGFDWAADREAIIAAKNAMEEELLAVWGALGREPSLGYEGTGTAVAAALRQSPAPAERRPEREALDARID